MLYYLAVKFIFEALLQQNNEIIAKYQTVGYISIFGREMFQVGIDEDGTNYWVTFIMCDSLLCEMAMKSAIKGESCLLAFNLFSNSHV